MYKWIYVLATGEWLYGGPTEPDYNPATQGCALLLRHPKPRTERHGAGPTFIRPATAQEMLDYDAAQLDSQVTARFDTEQLTKAVAIWAATKLNVPLPTAKAEILAILKGLS